MERVRMRAQRNCVSVPAASTFLAQTDSTLNSSFFNSPARTEAAASQAAWFISPCLNILTSPLKFSCFSCIFLSSRSHIWLNVSIFRCGGSRSNPQKYDVLFSYNFLFPLTDVVRTWLAFEIAAPLSRPRPASPSSARARLSL